MRYFLLLLSTVIILYAGYILIKCIELINSLTEYGKGYLTGSVFLLAIGISIFIYSLKRFKKKTNKI